MSIDKARAALADACNLTDRADVDHNGNIPLHILENFSQLARVAECQAGIATAEAAERSAAALEKIANILDARCR